jgi:hypothetical protein
MLSTPCTAIRVEDVYVRYTNIIVEVTMKPITQNVERR